MTSAGSPHTSDLNRTFRRLAQLNRVDSAISARMGHHAVEQRQPEVLHGYRRQIGDQQRQHQLDGLQLTDLPLAAEPQTRDQQQVQDDGAEKRSCQAIHALSIGYFSQYAPAGRKYAARSVCIDTQNVKGGFGHRFRHKRHAPTRRRIFSANTSLQKLEIQKVFLRFCALS